MNPTRRAERFGHGFTVAKSGYQMHGIVTHVIDGRGTWAANFHGLGFETANLVVYLDALVNDHGGHAEARPAGRWDRFRAHFRL